MSKCWYVLYDICVAGAYENREGEGCPVVGSSRTREGVRVVRWTVGWLLLNVGFHLVIASCMFLRVARSFVIICVLIHTYDDSLMMEIIYL